MEIEFDPDKEATNLAKHEISLSEAPGVVEEFNGWHVQRRASALQVRRKRL